MQLSESIESKVYYNEKSKKCFAKTILTVWLPEDKLKTFIGKGDAIKHTNDVENKKFAEVLALVRSNREALRQYEDSLLICSKSFSTIKKAKKVHRDKESKIYTNKKGIDKLLDLIGGTADPVFVKGMSAANVNK